MKKILTLFFLCVLFLVLDNTLVPFFAIKGYYPSILLLFSIFYSVINGSREGVWIGVFSGALQDLYFFNGFGVNIFANMLICVSAGLIGTSIFKEKRLIPVVSSFFLIFIKGILVLSILYIAQVYTEFDRVLFNSLYSIIIGIFMYKPVYRLCQKEYMQKNWSFYDK